jgi:hypothetical protein
MLTTCGRAARILRGCPRDVGRNRPVTGRGTSAVQGF